MMMTEIDWNVWWNDLDGQWKRCIAFNLWKSFFSELNQQDYINRIISRNAAPDKLIDLEELRLTCIDRAEHPFEHEENWGDVGYFESVSASLAPIENLINLKKLDASWANVWSLEPLRNLHNLTELNFEHLNFISDLSPLENLTNLESLSFHQSFSQIATLQPLCNLTKLRSLKFGHWLPEMEQKTARPMPLKSLNGLESLFELEELIVSFADISDLKPLRNLSMLKYLDLSLNRISNLEPIKSLENLGYLFFTGNYVTDLDPLMNLNKLIYLDCHYNQISTLSPLRQLKNLEEIHCDQNPIDPKETRIEHVKNYVLSDADPIHYWCRKHKYMTAFASPTTNANR